MIVLLVLSKMIEKYFFYYMSLSFLCKHVGVNFNHNKTFLHHDRGLTKYHAGFEQTLVYVVIINSRYPTAKNNSTDYHAFGKYWMQARRYLQQIIVSNIAGQKLSTVVVYCVCQPNELKREIMKNNWASKRWAKQKSGGPWPTQASL